MYLDRAIPAGSTGNSETKFMAMILKDILRRKLKEAGVGAPTLAKKTGISRQTIANWLEGQKPQNLEQVKKVADHFGMTIDELCFGPSLRSQPLNDEIEKHRDEINAGIFEVVLRRVR